MPVPIRLATAVVACMTLVLVSCGESRPAPGPSPLPPPPPTPPSSTVVAMELLAPSEIAPGESVQLTARATMSDGSVEDVTSRAVWSGGNPAMLQISSTGLATGVSRGETEVVVRIGPPNVPHASKRIFIVPKGTFVLGGNFLEQGVAIPGVTVTVLSGTGQGLSSQGSSAFFRLYGVAGPVELELKKDGFHTASYQVNVTEHMTRDFEVVSIRRPDYRGTYTLTLTASPDCTGLRNLPEEARRREYIATVSHEGARIAVSLSGADFLTSNGRGNGFSGRLVTYERVDFKISDAYWDEYYGTFVPGPFDIAERVGDSTVVFEGFGSAQITDSRFSGTLGGTIAVSRNAVPPFDPFIALCPAGPSSHKFEMVRR